MGRGGLEQSQTGAEAVMERIFWLQPHRWPEVPWLPSIICKCLLTVSVVLARSDVHQIASTVCACMQILAHMTCCSSACMDVMITLSMLMQNIEVDEGEFNIMDVAEDTIVDGRWKFGELLDHFARDLCLRRSALGYASL